MWFGKSKVVQRPKRKFEIARNSKEPYELGKSPYLCELNEDEVQKLPYVGPIGRRIYFILQDSTKVGELFVQRNDAFTTDLVELLRRVKTREISEIRYSVGFDAVVRIFLGERGKLAGEFMCKSERTLRDFKRNLGLK